MPLLIFAYGVIPLVTTRIKPPSLLTTRPPFARTEWKKMTSAELAELVGLSHDFLRQIQSEKVGYNFSLETFYKISVALGVSMDELAKREEE